MMPGKNGMESIVEIREQRPDAKVYFMTGTAPTNFLRKLLLAGP
jgi:DNA-binding NarL/FixJ family response regulator